MKRVSAAAAKILTGFFVTAVCALPQGYTISAKPGAVNFVEGNAYVNGSPVSAQNLKATFLNANDELSTKDGKAEVLLTPGVFLRVGANTAVRMISPSLTDTRLEIESGEAMVEADDIVKDNRITVVAAGATASIERNGLYRFNAGDVPAVAVLEGKLQLLNGDRKTDINKGHEVFLSEGLKSSKFDTKKGDDLYAWSNVRSEYNAASSYQAARDVNSGNYGGVWGNYGYGGWSSPGWFWNSGFNSWAWLPGNAAYFSPFGYGFYGPGMIGYAPVIYAPLNGGGYYNGRTVASGGGTSARRAPVAVPVNPASPPAVGVNANSLASVQAARTQAARTFSSTGYRTMNGGAISASRATAMVGGGNGGRAAAPAASSGGFSGGGRAAASSVSAPSSMGGSRGASAPAAHK